MFFDESQLITNAMLFDVLVIFLSTTEKKLKLFHRALHSKAINRQTQGILRVYTQHQRNCYWLTAHPVHQKKKAGSTCH
jgi:hypothetical protein